MTGMMVMIINDGVMILMISMTMVMEWRWW